MQNTLVQARRLTLYRFCYRTASVVLAVVLSCCVSAPVWAQEVRRAVPELESQDKNHIYSYVIVGVLALGIVLIGFKGAKPTR
jgi:hypothetical protein